MSSILKSHTKHQMYLSSYTCFQKYPQKAFTKQFCPIFTIPKINITDSYSFQVVILIFYLQLTWLENISHWGQQNRLFILKYVYVRFGNAVSKTTTQNSLLPPEYWQKHAIQPSIKIEHHLLWTQTSARWSLPYKFKNNSSSYSH